MSRYEFLPAIATAINDQDTIITALQPQTAFKIQAVQSNSSIQLRFINEADSTIYVWQDDVMLLASDNPNVREQVLRSHHFWFDCDNSRFEKVIGEILSTTDLRRRIDQANVWRNQSAAAFYLLFEQKLYQEQTFTIDELIPPSGAGLLRYFHLEHCVEESLSFHEKLINATELLLVTEGLEICLERLSCIPVKLPKPVREAFSQMQLSERKSLLERLTLRLTSPLCKLHLIDLALLSSDNTKKVKSLIDEIFSEAGELQFRLFRVLLDLVNNEFSHWHETKDWLPSIRLSIIWAHTSKLYNLLYNPTVIVDEFVQRLKTHAQSRAISADIINRNPVFWNDVLHPRRLNRITLVAHGLAAILAEQDPVIFKAIGITEKMANFAVRTIEDKQFLDPILWHDDSALAQDNLGALLGGDRSKYIGLLLGTELGHQVSSEQLKAVVENAIDALVNEPLARDQWLSIIAVIGDRPIYNDLVDKFSILVRSIDILELYRAEPFTAIFALSVAADHVSHTSDEDLRLKLEQTLVVIAGLINSQEQIERVDNKIADQILETILKLAIRANDPYATSHSLNSLFTKISFAWPGFANTNAIGLFRVVQELPANQLHGAWATVLYLRALRSNT